jgi:hypothetical protein
MQGTIYGGTMHHLVYLACHTIKAKLTDGFVSGHRVLWTGAGAIAMKGTINKLASADLCQFKAGTVDATEPDGLTPV